MRIKKNRWGWFFIRIICTLAFLFLFSGSSSFAGQASQSVVIVIDPGHGGDNLGAEYGSYTEKYINMTVARAMREELEKYDGVTVYLTHESTEDNLSLKERAEFARDKKADFLFSLHFNMSENHNLFGTEVWVSAFDRYYANGHAFAQIEMELLTGLGLYSRGIKTRLNDEGDDYYGILRESRALGLNCALIEHCHLDQANDQPFYQQGEHQLTAFGQLNATAVAKYFRLSSAALNVDYSDYPVPSVPEPAEKVLPDLTPPEVCRLTLDQLAEDTGKADFTLTAEDADSRILYYGYSLDGGRTYGELEPFPAGEKTVTFSLDLPLNRNLLVCAVALNAYDRVTESQWIEITAPPPESATAPEGSETATDAETASQNTETASEAGGLAGTQEQSGAETEETTGLSGRDASGLPEIPLPEILRPEGEAEKDGLLRDLNINIILIALVASLMLLVVMILISRIVLLRRERRRG